MSAENQKTLSIIGGGIGGLLSAFYLIQDKKTQLKIRLFQSPLYPACTLSSTSTVALRGTTKGHSKLGDYIVDGFHEVGKFIETYRPQGVEKSKLITFNHPMSPSFDKVKTRYNSYRSKAETHGFTCYEEDFYYFSPHAFVGWLMVQLMPYVEFVNETVVSYSDHEIITDTKKTFATDYLLLAAGAYSSFLSEEKKVKDSKPVAGAYLEYKDVDLGNTTFCQTYNELNAVYSAKEKKLLFGSASEDGFCFSANLPLLKSRYEEWQNAHITRLPPMEEATIKVGIRQKAQKREPYLLPLNKEKTSWALGGLYKNGYSVGFILAKELTRKF